MSFSMKTPKHIRLKNSYSTETKETTANRGSLH